MTKKHFEAAAQIVRAIRAHTDNRPSFIRSEELKAITVESAYIELFRQFNPRFDAERFKAACRPPAE